jgi:hypothetical protein
MLEHRGMGVGGRDGGSASSSTRRRDFWANLDAPHPVRIVREAEVEVVGAD